MARRIEPILVEMREALDGIEIISEAARHMPDAVLELAPEIPWEQVRGIGNILRHECHKTSDSLVWAVVTENLTPLRRAIERIAESVADENRTANRED